MSEEIAALTPAPDESDSLEEHEAAFGPGGTGETSTTEADRAPEPVSSTENKPESADSDPSTTRDDQGRFKSPRHRAKSQQASPQDVPRIAELTAKLRAAEAERDALKNQPVQRQPEPQRQQPPPVQQQASSFPETRPEPSEDEVGTKYPTYAAFTRDQALWVHEQERAKDRAQQQYEAEQKTAREWGTAHGAREAQARQMFPDYDAQLEAANRANEAERLNHPRVFNEAILSSERSAEITYWLATHRDEYRQLVQEAWPVNYASSVNMVRRVLESRLPVASPQRSNERAAAGSTGSAPPSPFRPAARPPNPVRTGPQKIGDDAPDDEGSLDAHEQYFHRRK